MKMVSSWFGFGHKETKVEDDRSFIINGQLVPLDIIKKITHGLSFITLQNCSLLSRSWRHFIPASLFQTKRLELCERMVTPLNYKEGKTEYLLKNEFLKAFKELPLDIESIPCPLHPRKKLLETHLIFYFPEFFKTKSFQKGNISFLESYGIDFSVRSTVFFKSKSNKIRMNSSGWFAVIKEPFTADSPQKNFTLSEKTHHPYEVCKGFDALLYALKASGHPFNESGSLPLLFHSKNDWFFVLSNGFNILALEPADWEYQFLAMVKLNVLAQESLLSD